MATKQTKQTKVIDYYDYHELAEEVCELLGRDIRDYHESHMHFNKWCDATGRGQTDPEGKHRNSSQIWYSEYKADPNGEPAEPEYCDFWHWWIDQGHEVGHNVYEEGVNFVEIRKDLLDGEYDANKQGWIIEILDAFIQVLGADCDQDVTIYYDW